MYQDISSKDKFINIYFPKYECIKIYPQKGSGQGAEQALGGSACPGRETLWRGGRKFSQHKINGKVVQSKRNSPVQWK